MQFHRAAICSAGLVIGLALATTAHAATTIELAVNGDFETGDYTGWAQFPTGAGQQTVTNVNPSSGVFAGAINNDVAFSNSLIKQANIGIGQVTPGQMVSISFDARGSYAAPGGVAFAEFFSELDGGGTSSAEILGGAPLAINGDPDVWTSFNFTATTGPDVTGGITLQLGATNGPGTPTQMFYDNVSITIESTAIPEPASAAFLCLGGIGMMLRRRRRR